MLIKRKYPLCEAADEQQSAGAPAVAETPREPAAPVDESFAESGVDWADMSDAASEDVGTTDWGDEPPAVSESPEAAAPTEAAPEAQQPAAEQPLQQTPEAPEQLQQPQQFTPDQIRAAEAAYAAQLANLYTFDEDTAMRLQTEPEKVLPALAAKLHLDVMKTVMAQMRGMLPEMMQTQTKSVERETQAKSQFFSAWPELQGYEQQVLEVGRMYRQLNKNAPAEEAIRRIGETAMAALGLQRRQQQEQQERQPPQQSFRPAVPGRVNPPSGSSSVWDELINEE